MLIRQEQLDLTGIRQAIIDADVTFERKTPLEPPPDQGEPVYYEASNGFVFSAAPWVGFFHYDVTDYGGASGMIVLDGEGRQALDAKMAAADAAYRAPDPYENHHIYGLAANR